nr:aminotransferase class V-fold PLP-dependent enzyme [Clostridium fungisolvens]
MNDEIREIGGERIPYFRTDEFSSLMLENEKLIKKLMNTSDKSKAAFLTASGTGAMEAAIMNMFNQQDKLLVVVGGSFGERFKQICEIYNINHDVIQLNQGEQLTKDRLYEYSNKGYTGMLINAHETSTGVYYDLQMVGEFCSKENMFFIVDSISSFLADPYYMDEWKIDLTIISSQKALALPPGISAIVMNERTVEKIYSNEVKCLYFNLKDYIENGKRGQTPFTPAVGILIQLNYRLKYVDEIGLDNIIEKTKVLAEDFRSKIAKFPFTIPSERLSNAVTPLKPKNGLSAYYIYTYLKENYNIYLCPSGGSLKDSLVRVGHIGELNTSDNDVLIDALSDMERKGII